MRVICACCMKADRTEKRDAQKSEGSILSKMCAWTHSHMHRKGHRIGWFYGGGSVGVVFFTFAVAWG